MDPLFKKKEISIDVLRLDKIHTIISGNKWFKLKYYLQEVLRQGKRGIISFGGPYSNHLVATSYACQQAGLSSIGIIRGEEPVTYSAPLLDMQSYGMQLLFTSRKQYRDAGFIAAIMKSHPDFLMVDEGGRGHNGIKGAEEILQLTSASRYSHVLCAVGTGTMLTGILNSSLATQHIVGISSLKLTGTSREDIVHFIAKNSCSSNFSISNDFHFGGYAKKNSELIGFMNSFYLQHGIPSDFVYTGKLFYALIKLIEENYFTNGNEILVIHSGGLQGNRSLAPGTLSY
jgi:1-aminocyclopropane-1-carboxylate deaminase/D-cysteine desulfhydrase-like pyridoxal-dependent ACC family enzyme